ncbi:MAG: hypothetical protein A2Y38_12760 [Spirochaetes bacterium GWB1_59_5]|nr:MAG: hypothetical protein A2Y38_12760 [Spirochaetes bacterium GWB1_59_5]
MASEQSWRDIARNLLNERPASLKMETIAKDIGVSSAWLRMFARGEINNPGVMTIQELTVYLKNYKKKG